MNFSTGQRLAGPYSAPGFRPKTGCVIFVQAKFFLRGFHFVRRHHQFRRHRFRVGAQCGNKMQILVNLVGRLRVESSQFELHGYGRRRSAR